MPYTSNRRHERAQPVRRALASIVALALVSLVAVPAGAQDESVPTVPPPETTTTTEPSTATTTTEPSTTTTTTEPSTTTTTTAPESSTSTSTTIEADEGPEHIIAPPPDDGGPPVVVPPGAISPDRAAILEELRRDFEGATIEELDFFARLLAAQTLAENLAEEIELLDVDLVTIGTSLTQAQERLGEAEAQLARTRARLVELDGRLGTSREILERRAIEAYMMGGTAAPALASFLSAEDANEAELSLTYSHTVIADNQEVIAQYVRIRDEIERTLTVEEAEQRALRAARDEVAARHGELAERRTRQERARETVQLTVVESEELLAEATVRRSEYERRIAAVAAVSDGIAGTLASLQEGQEPPRISTGIFVPPIRDMRVTSPFGPRIHPIYGSARMHNGMDIDGRMGTPIRAADAGVVLLAEDRGGYGLAVVIDHGNTLGTLYAHMSSFAVRPGDLVERGDVLGGVGSTGQSTGPHLHFEVRVLGQPVNPASYVGPER